MNLNKVGKFILELRNEKTLSQKELANMIPVTREAVSKWENGKSLPDSSTLLILSKIFNVTIDELLCGERTTEKDNMKKITLELVDEYNLKKKKIKNILTTSIFSITLLIICFLTYYFISSYNTIKVYKIEGQGEEFYTNNGILIATKQKSYLRLGKLESINNKSINKIENVKLYYINNKNKKKTIYEDNSTDILISTFYGYDEYFSYDELTSIEKELYIEIKYDDGQEDTVHLNVVKDFSNNLIFYSRDEKISTNNNNENQHKESDFSKKTISHLKQKGNEINDMYIYTIKEKNKKIIISYFQNEVCLEINDLESKKVWTYYIDKEDYMHYVEYKKDKEINNIFIDCDKLEKINASEKEIYNDFFEKIKKYLF